MFYSTNIELFPDLDWVVNGFSSSGTSAFLGIKTTYLLSPKIIYPTGLGYSHLLGGYNYYQGGFENIDNFRFGGMVLYEKFKNNTNVCLRGLPNAKSLFSIFADKGIDGKLMSSFSGTSQELKKKFKPLEQYGVAIVLEDENWLPIFSELEDYKPHYSLVDGGIFSTVNDRIVRIFNGKKYISKYANRHDKFLYIGEYETHSYESDNIWFARNGKYASYSGNTLKFFDENDNEIASATQDNLLYGQMNSNGTVFYGIYGDSIDTSNTATQNINQTLIAFDTSNANELFSFDIILNSNEEARGVYCANRESKIQVLVTLYESNDSELLPTGSSVVSLDEDGSIALNTALSDYALNIAPSFAEDAEFVCYSKNKVIRCFGS
jgi:hypothetical protein